MLPSENMTFITTLNLLQQEPITRLLFAVNLAYTFWVAALVTSAVVVGLARTTFSTDAIRTLCLTFTIRGTASSSSALVILRAVVAHFSARNIIRTTGLPRPRAFTDAVRASCLAFTIVPAVFRAGNHMNNNYTPLYTRDLNNRSVADSSHRYIRKKWHLSNFLSSESRGTKPTGRIL